jgi:choline dehydrogenase-like flavoprotein
MIADNIHDLFAQHSGPLRVQCCVIGSGPAGAVVGCELAKAGWDVAIVEAGGVSTPIHDESIESLEIDGRRGTSVTRVGGLGGSSNAWGGLVAAMDPIDISGIGGPNSLGWPLPYVELNTYYDRALHLLGVDRSRIESSSEDSLNLRVSRLEAKSFAFLDYPINVSSFIYNCKTKKGRLKVWTNAITTRICIDEFGHVDAVHILDGGKVQRKLHADVFVIAAGGIETPRLLLNSDDVQTSGIGNGSDLVGRFLTTHPKSICGTVRLGKNFYRAINIKKYFNGDAYLALGMRRDALYERSLLNNYITILPIGSELIGGGVDFLKKKLRCGSARVAVSNRNGGPGLRPRVRNAIARIQSSIYPSGPFEAHGYFDEFPDYQNRVYRGTSTDSFGIPKVRIEWKLNKQSRHSLIRFFQTLESEMVEKELGRFESRMSDVLNNNNFVGFHSHHIGTTRMADSPANGVVDKNGKVFSASNLYLAGPSVFAAPGSANPFLTIVAMSLRLADHLSFPKIPSGVLSENSIRLDSHSKAESSHP